MLKTILLLALSCLTCNAQVLQGLKKTVAFVYGQAHIKTPDGQTILLDGPLGTAFFVFYPDSRGGENYGFVYAVTAKHVLRDEVAEKYVEAIRLRINKKDGTGIEFGILPVVNKGELSWFTDKDDANADIAVLPCQPPMETLDYQPFPVSAFADKETFKTFKVTEGDSVYLVGLMPQFTGESHNYPVVRHGTIAMLAEEPIPFSATVKEKVYVVELGSWPGQSGSPVFLSLGGMRGGGIMLGESYRLLGIMLASVQNQRPFQVVTPNASGFIGDSSNVGISYVLPADEITKILNSKELQKLRDDDIEGKKLKAGKPASVLESPRK